MNCIKDLTDCKIFLLSRILFLFAIWVSLIPLYSVGFIFVLFCWWLFFSCFVTVLKPESFDFMYIFIFNESRDSNVTK